MRQPLLIQARLQSAKRNSQRHRSHFGRRTVILHMHTNNGAHLLNKTARRSANSFSLDVLQTIDALDSSAVSSAQISTAKADNELRRAEQDRAAKNLFNLVAEGWLGKINVHRLRPPPGPQIEMWNAGKHGNRRIDDVFVILTAFEPETVYEIGTFPGNAE